MSDSSRLAEKAQGLHLGQSGDKSSIRSAATAAAAAYAWRKASRPKDGRSGLTVVPTRPAADGFMTMATTSGNPSPPMLGRRVSTSAVTLSHQLSFGSRDVDSTPDMTVDSRSVLNEARAKLASVEKKTVDQWRKAAADAKALSQAEKGEQRLLHLEHQLSRVEDELRDAALIEVALYSVVAEHGSSAHKVHTPARRLARFYKYAYKNWGLERRAAIAKTMVSGLVLVSRACGNDVPRLTYWWSNVVVLRETILQSCEDSGEVGSPGGDGDADSSPGNDFQARAFRSQQLRKSKSDVNFLMSPPGHSKDWRTSAMLVATLFRIETWLHARVLESVWWQAMTPRMQLGGTHAANVKGSSADLNGDLSKYAGDSRDFAKDKMNYNSRKLGDTRQGNISVEIWKRAFTDALKRLCPLQGEGLECGCLPALYRMIIEECVVRLDVAMFNGILRDPDDDSPTDPLADPITDLSVLPIPIGGLTFGAGSHLKNVVVNWSTWLSALVSCKDRVPAEFRSSLTDDAEDEDPVQFNLLKATGDLLMLPKDILLDAEIRKEVCPGLNLPLIRRVLANFTPDDFSPDPISPGLLNALATEVANERRKFGEDDISPDDIAMACVPPVTYMPPPTSFVKLWIGEPANSTQWGRSVSSALRKGYTSDEELEEYENPLSLLQDKPRYGADNGSHGKNKKKDGLGASRFQLLKEIWKD